MAKPAEGSKIDGFGYIEAKVKATMVGASEGDDELILFLLDFGNFEGRVLFLQMVGVYHDSLMPEVFRTFGEVRIKKLFRLLFENLPLFPLNAVPEL